jgi:hypothetical protein
MAPILSVHFRNESSWLVGQLLANSDLTDKLGVANLASISVRADILSALEVGLRLIPESGSASARDHRTSSSDRCSPTLCEAAEAHARGSILWAWLCTVWQGWKLGIFIIRASTVLGWHRKGFRSCWTWKIRRGKLGRPTVPKEVRELIRTMSRENPLWGAPRIHGELLKLGIDIGETSVSKYLVRGRKPP